MIAGRGVYLRPARLEDYEAWAALREQSRAYLEPREPAWRGDELSVDRFRQRLADQAREMESDLGYAFLIFRNDHRLVGGLTLGPVHYACANLGTWIGAEFAGRGYAIWASHAALEFGFRRLLLRRVTASCLPENAASIRGMEFLGFRREPNERAFLTIGGAPREHLVFAIEEPWLKRPSIRTMSA